MLHREIKTLIFLLAIFFCSCKSKSKIAAENTLAYKAYSQKIVESEYNLVLQQAHYTLINWKANKLNNFRYLQLYPFHLDSLLCFNSKKNKVISTILISDKLDNSNNSDGLIYFYGVKIKNNWYFFTGATVVLPRSFYQNDTHTPLSFEKLHEIAMQEVFNGYLIKDDKGVWQVNEDWFKYHFEGTSWGYTLERNSEGYNVPVPYKTKEEYEKAYLEKVANNWYLKDTIKPKVNN